MYAVQAARYKRTRPRNIVPLLHARSIMIIFARSLAGADQEDGFRVRGEWPAEGQTYRMGR